MMIDDMDLVREYARCKSEEAFATLVSRHVNLVYSVAFRHVRDPQVAEEITQTVFVILARKAGSLNSRTVVSSWLCRTARYASAKTVTMQRRRQKREQEAYMQSESNEGEPNAWIHIEPLLDAALGQPGEKDHNAVVLRFFEGRSFKDVSAALGTSEAGAKMRVNRALEKLRKFFTKRRLTFPAAVFAAAISANSVHAAPIGLATSVTLAAVKGTVVTTSTLTLIKSTLKIMAWTKLKTAGSAGLLALLVAGTATAVIHTVNAQTNAGKGSVKTSPFPFAGYSTPEAALQSLLRAMSTGDLEKVKASCTHEQAERFRTKLEGKSPDDIRRALVDGANSMVGFQLNQHENISSDEVRLHLLVQPYPGHPRVGHDVQVMRKIGSEWKYAGKYGVDIKEK